MQDALVTLVIAVVAVGAVVAIYTLAVTGRSLREIGARGLELGASPEPTDHETRDEEIRQMLAARERRREQRAQAPPDADGEGGGPT